MVQAKNNAAPVAAKNNVAPTAAKVNETTLKIVDAKLPLITPEKKETSPASFKKSLPSIGDRLAKLEELNLLREKHDLVTEALKNVSNFYISPNGNCNVKMTDSNGKVFSIGHPFVIEEILTVVTFKLEQELDKIETLIDFNF